MGHREPLTIMTLERPVHIYFFSIPHSSSLFSFTSSFSHFLQLFLQTQASLSSFSFTSSLFSFTSSVSHFLLLFLTFFFSFLIYFFSFSFSSSLFHFLLLFSHLLHLFLILFCSILKLRLNSSHPFLLISNPVSPIVISAPLNFELHRERLCEQKVCFCE